MEKDKCIICGKSESEYAFDYLEVQTLHIRDLTGEKRVQALGETGSGCVCKACAAKKLGQIENQTFPVKSLAPFIIIFLIGVFLCAFGLGRDKIFLMMGAAAIACGIMGSFSRLRNDRRFFPFSNSRDNIAIEAHRRTVTCLPSFVNLCISYCFLKRKV